MKSLLRNSLISVTVVALIGGLAGLTYKMQVVDTSTRQQVNAQLRELKQIDAEWNLDVLRSKIGINSNYDPVNTPLHWLQLNQDVLLATIEKSNPNAKEIKDATADLRMAINDKIALVDRFKMQHSLLRNSLHFLPTATQQLHQQIILETFTANEAANVPAGNAPAKTENTETRKSTRSTQSSVANFDLSKLDSTVNELLTEVLKYNLTPDPVVKSRIEGLVTALDLNKKAYPEKFRQQLNMIINHTKAILTQKVNEDEVLAKIEQVPISTRINVLGERFEQGFEAALKAQEKWRMALIAYALGLLLLLAFMGMKLWKSYRSLDQANASLEQRVVERTQELSTALQNLKESELQLIQSEKMASLGQMVAGIAHEINTPLAYVKSGLEILDSRVNDVDALLQETSGLVKAMTQEDGSEEALAERFASVQEITNAFMETEAVGEVKTLLKDGLYGIEQIAEIVRNLKDFSRLDRAKLDQFNVNDGLNSTLNIARNVVKRRNIIKQFDTVPLITCSPAQINQVFLNLINNACHATSAENGTITLHTAPTPTGVMIEISDNGKGIAPDILPKIFDPFFTTKKVGEGTGLGLSIVQRIIKEHGGDIKVTSTVGVGTCFTIFLPRKYEPKTDPALAQLNEPAANLAAGNVPKAA